MIVFSTSIQKCQRTRKTRLESRPTPGSTPKLEFKIWKSLILTDFAENFSFFFEIFSFLKYLLFFLKMLMFLKIFIFLKRFAQKGTNMGKMSIFKKKRKFQKKSKKIFKKTENFIKIGQNLKKSNFEFQFWGTSRGRTNL